MTDISNISPIDGRYKSKTETLSDFFSEKALIYYRVLVEIEWFKFLAKKPEIEQFRAINPKEELLLDNILTSFSEQDALRVKEIEKTTNHDVKAVEYFLKEKAKDSTLSGVLEWFHFACTSEDINNLSYSLMLRDACNKVFEPEFESLFETIQEKTREGKAVPLLSLTHGQPASPTTVGKAFLLFETRFRRQIDQLKKQEYLGKINGATGNFNAHSVAYPNADWLSFSKEFVESVGLTWNPVTDQIEPHDFIAEISHNFIRINTILLDLSRDVWGYISRGIFRQKLKEGEIGSSAMPHKVNPIDFENAEGNLGISNALFEFFAQKLPISRWQRDLTDSTVLRNLGVAFAHTLIALKSLEKGLGKLELSASGIEKEFTENPEVLAEAIQTVMRKNNVQGAYEQLKELTRGKKVTVQDFHSFIKTLDIPQEDKNILLNLTPEKYVGIAAQIVEKFSK